MGINVISTEVYLLVVLLACAGLGLGLVWWGNHIKSFYLKLAGFALIVGVFLTLILRYPQYGEAISICATLALAIAAFLSILSVSEERKRHGKERLLNDIIEWAQEIENFSIAPDVKFAYIQDPKERQTMENIHWVDILDSKARHGKMIKSRAQVLNSSTISQSINDLITEIEKVSGMLLHRDSTPLVYKPAEFIKVQELNNKAIDLMIKLDEYKS